MTQSVFQNSFNAKYILVIDGFWVISGMREGVGHQSKNVFAPCGISTLIAAIHADNRARADR